MAASGALFERSWFQRALQEFLQENYSLELQLSFPKSAFAQLALFEHNELATPECSAKVLAQHKGFEECKRAFSRWHSLELLRRAREDDWESFTQHQAEDKLSLENFNKLAAAINNLPHAAQAGLTATCFIAVSKEARMRAEQAGFKPSADSEIFITDVVTQCPDIFPMVKRMSAEEKAFMPMLYLSLSHGRHMLYTEGGNNMFTTLRERIREGSLTREQYEVWFARWIVNIAGFRGNLQHQGSIYLNNTKAEYIFLLKTELDKLWENAAYDVLGNYLQACATKINLSSKFLAHMSCMTRLYKEHEGQQLQAWFDSISGEEQQACEASYENFINTCTLSPTYEPAVLANLLDLGCSISEASNIYLKIRQQAYERYQQSCQETLARGEKILPLCFRDVADANKTLRNLVQYYKENRSVPVIEFDDKCVVTCPIPAQEDSLIHRRRMRMD